MQRNRKPGFFYASAAFMLAGIVQANALNVKNFGFDSQLPQKKPVMRNVSAAHTIHEKDITSAAVPQRKPTEPNKYAPSTNNLQKSNSPLSALGLQAAHNAKQPQTTQNQAAIISQTFQNGLAQAQAHSNELALSNLIKSAQSKDLARAFFYRSQLTDTLDIKIADWWLIAYAGDKLPPRFIAEFAAKHPSWPTPKLMRAKGEASLAAANLPPRQVVAAFGRTRPETVTGKLLLAKSYLKIGNSNAAYTILQKIWFTQTLDLETQSSLLKASGSLLNAQDHYRRAVMLIMTGYFTQAKALFPYLTKQQENLLIATTSALSGQKSAHNKLKALPNADHYLAPYIYSMVKAAREAEDYPTAAKWLEALSAEQERNTAPDEWWVQRRVISRHLAEEGNYRGAYAIAAVHQATSKSSQVEAEFHAGWYALTGLNDAKTATIHFTKITQLAQMPVSLSKAHYWLGRCAEKLGQTQKAIQSYTRSAVYQTTYYGQLAQAKLGRTALSLPNTISISPEDASSFNNNEIVKAIYRLKAADMHNSTVRLYASLAKSLKTPGQLALLTNLAMANQMPQWALMAGKLTAIESPKMATLAFPLVKLPRSVANISHVELPVIYAISRKESAFNPAAKSRVGALGYMQLMPSTAKATAKKLGLRYSRQKLTQDPAYNATLGAALLHELIDEFNGSYILAFAAYNAGKTKAYEWINRFGDPRNPQVDPINWVEKIPYGETRNYVQRVLESIQVYRYKLDNQKLAIINDLTRG
ncbi:lytic transglycosylase domain-containing protein [Polycladidibacter stylochi]|uniref:lytic transglycosylase domain-containing protein n=1 Tax=Polycladidibacter stylochi TaxID=1807766 RepID=UPI00082BDB8D|nr:lytic transglycosylase domain-containing protein [Pseudovibrio stylochi]